MQLHPLATEFAAVADAYEHGRPEYAPAVVGALSAELRLGPRARVLDLAAGTGKFSRALVAAGLDVLAVEPQESLRCKLVDSIGSSRVQAGFAEEIPAGDASVDAVTVADAFHWFDAPVALAEIRRVLRPGGGLAILTTLQDWRPAAWGPALTELVFECRPAHPQFDGPPWQEKVRATGGWSEPNEIRVIAPQPAEAGRVLDYFASLSWVSALSGADRVALLARAGELVRGAPMPATLPVVVSIGLVLSA